VEWNELAGRENHIKVLIEEVPSVEGICIPDIASEEGRGMREGEGKFKSIRYLTISRRGNMFECNFE
jgi:hypothetical protein